MKKEEFLFLLIKLDAFLCNLRECYKMFYLCKHFREREGGRERGREREGEREGCVCESDV